MDRTIDVLICGAGAAGLTLAIDLARRGVPFRLIEKADTPFHGSRGKGIQPRTQEIFEDLGILDRAVAVGGMYPPQRAYHKDGSYTDSELGEHPLSTPSEPYYLPLLVPQFLTEAVMRERLTELGHRVEFGCELIGINQDADVVTTRVRTRTGEETIHARYLIGADGGRSFVRSTLGIGFPGKTLGVRAMVADVMLTGLSRDAWHKFNEDAMDRMLFVCPLMGTDLFQLQGPVPLEGEVDLCVAGLNAMVAERIGRNDIEVRSVSWASAYHMNARLAERYRDGRVFLIGDAAHVHPPTGGQGLNTSVQDAYNLGWKLAAVLAGAPYTLLDTYEDERKPVAASMLGLSTKLLDALKRGDNRRGREVHQLDIGYSESSIALEMPERATGCVLAGDRAPDAPIRGVAGQSMRLFELFKGPHWTLLGYNVERAAVSPRRNLHIHVFGKGGDLIDGGHFRDSYAPTDGDWILVRPDGYVGAIVSSNAIDALEQYFSQVGLGFINITRGPSWAETKDRSIDAGAWCPAVKANPAAYATTPPTACD